MKKVIFPIATIIFLALLSGCINIDSANQPTSAVAGDTITTTMQVSLAANTSGKYVPPAFAVKIPNDWSVVSVYYSGTGGASGLSGSLSQNSTASFDIESKSPSGPSYLWLGFSGTAKRVDVLPAGATVTVRLRTGAATGNYDINYTVGYSFNNSWYWTDYELRPITVSSPPTTGNISITSSPSGAEVIVDGVSKGTAAPTLTVSGVNPGSRTVKCRLSGYSDYETTVTVTAGGVATITCTLTTTPTTPTLTPPTVVLTSEPASVGPGQTSTIKVTVTGKDGAPISGASVMLSSTSGGTVSPVSGTTNPSGQFTSTFTGPAEGNATITAIVKKGGFADGFGEIQVVIIPPVSPAPEAVTPPPEEGINPMLIGAAIVILILAASGLYLWTKGNLKLAPKQTSVLCDGKSTLPIKVQFVNVFGKLRKQSKDREVEMETTSGKIQNVVILVGKEFIEATLTSSNECGPVTVTGKSGKQKATVQVNFVCEEAGLDVEVSPPEIPADGRSTATATIKIKDEKGNYISSLFERTVELTTTLGTITSPVKIPPKYLAGTAIVTSGQISGTAIVTASVGPLKGEGKIVFAELPKRYCMHCGAPMAMEAPSCPKCGKIPPSGVDTKQCSTCNVVLPLSAKFCDKCGARQPM